jgi:sugar/nucleoside kinase (ribokinase family)
MARIMTIGEILVEIMATERGQSFRVPDTLAGSFPSGAPAIFVDHVGRLGRPAGIIGCVGDDDLGWLNIDRLQRDGVDTRLGKVFAVQNRRRTVGSFSRLRGAKAEEAAR